VRHPAIAPAVIRCHGVAAQRVAIMGDMDFRLRGERYGHATPSDSEHASAAAAIPGKRTLTELQPAAAAIPGKRTLTELQPAAEAAPAPRTPGLPRFELGAPIQAFGLRPGVEDNADTPAPVPTGSGERLPAHVQQHMEAAFDTDFSDVRVHQGGHAAQLGALGYTQGNDLHFAPGQYNPSSESGMRLLGHELTHVVQQRQGRVAVPQGKGAPINSDPALESEADILGDRAARGESVRPAGTASAGGVQRAVIQRKGETLSPEVLLSSQQKTIPLVAKTAKDDYNLAHKDGEVNMWVNPTGASMAENPDFERAAKRFEQRLGQYLANESAPVLNMAAALTTRARAVATTAIDAKIATARKDLGAWFGADAPSRIGAVGKDEGVLDEVFAAGNLRERMTVIFNFMWAFSDYLINLSHEQIGRITANTTLDGQTFLNKTAIIKDHNAIRRDEDDKALPKETLTGMPDPTKNVGKQYETRTITDDPHYKHSDLSVAEVDKSHKLSDRELRLMFNDNKTPAEELRKRYAGEEVPWELGYKRWVMNENHEWVQTMRKLSLPTAAGPSATAWRVVKTAKHLGFTGRESLDMVRLAAAGYLLTIGAHSLMEVLDGAAPEGVSPHNPDRTVYTNLPPLPTSFLRERIGGGRFPHEPPEDRSLNTPPTHTLGQLDREVSDLVAITSNQTEPLLPQGTTATYKAKFLSGKRVNPDQYRMDWYWIDAAQSDTQQPRAVATEFGVDEWTHLWAHPGQYKIFCVVYKINRPPKEPPQSLEPQPSALTPLGVLRFDHGVAPTTDLPKRAKPPEPSSSSSHDSDNSNGKDKDTDSEPEIDFFGIDFDSIGTVKHDVAPETDISHSGGAKLSEPSSSSSKKEEPPKKALNKDVPTQKVPIMAWHRRANDDITVLRVQAYCIDEHKTGKWNARLYIPAVLEDRECSISEMVEFNANCFEDQPVDAMRHAIEMWRTNQISQSPRCAFPQGRLDIFGRVGDEAVREQFFLLDAPEPREPVRERVPTYRVQGGELGGQNATWVQFVPDQDQSLGVVHQATAWTNFGDMARTIKWLDKRTDRAYCLYLEVEESYLQGLARDAIPESTFIHLRGELALTLRALKELHDDKLDRWLAEIEDMSDRKKTEQTIESIRDTDLSKKVEEKDKDQYAAIKRKEMSVLMQRAESLYDQIEVLEALIKSGASPILSSDAATHQYGVTNRDQLQQSTVPGTVREIYQMRTLHLEQSLRSPRSIGKPAEDFSSTDYFKMRKIPFLGITPEDGLFGVTVKNVIPGSPASNVDILPGDLITRVADHAVATVADYTREVGALTVGTEAILHVSRHGMVVPARITPKAP
jgi:hypothetical protein